MCDYLTFITPVSFLVRQKKRPMPEHNDLPTVAYAIARANAYSGALLSLLAFIDLVIYLTRCLPPSACQSYRILLSNLGIP